MKKFFNPQNFATRRARSCQDGYALMMVIFFTALMLIGAMAVAPRILQEGKREKEKEMIWRGRQYVRGVKLYYRKMGRFPTSVDDLTKPKTGSLRFMRQAYKDPMNAEDGSWRLIYVGPAGQLPEDASWAEKLTPDEAQLAVRYAPIQLNGFPIWLESLAHHHPSSVDAVLGNELALELDEAIVPGWHSMTLQNIGYAPAAVANTAVTGSDAAGWIARLKAVRPPDLRVVLI